MSDSKKPTHVAYATRDYTDNGKVETRFYEIGAVWAHKDGKGFNLVLEALPVNGKIVVREPKATEADDTAEV